VLDLTLAAEVLAKEILGVHLYFLIIPRMLLCRLPWSKVRIDACWVVDAEGTSDFSKLADGGSFFGPKIQKELKIVLVIWDFIKSINNI
jgi:hypothetical protein